MTPAQVEEAARNLYNAVNDTFWSQDEVFKLIYRAELELAKEALVIEASSTTSTVIGTQTYAFPTGCIAMKRVTYDGQKLQKIDFRDDDSLTLSNAATTATGRPQWYYEWNDTVYLRPIPDSVLTLGYFYYKEPTLLTTASTTLSVPTRYHSDLVDYVVSQMYAKDQQMDGARYYRDFWLAKVISAKQWEMKKKRRDTFATVKNEEAMVSTILGRV